MIELSTGYTNFALKSSIILIKALVAFFFKDNDKLFSTGSG